MEDHSAWSLGRLFRALGYAWAGLNGAWRGEPAFRLELAVLGGAVPLALWAGQTGVERAILIGSVVLVLVVELVNSAVEATVDRIGTDRHALSKRAKDLGAAAVLVSVLNAVVVWTVILIDRSR